MRIQRCLLLVVLATCCVACGQKGPLVLPDKHAKTPVPATATPTAPPLDKDKDKDKPAAPKNQ